MTKHIAYFMFWVGFTMIALSNAFGIVHTSEIPDAILTSGFGIMWAILSLKENSDGSD